MQKTHGWNSVLKIQIDLCSVTAASAECWNEFLSISYSGLDSTTLLHAYMAIENKIKITCDKSELILQREVLIVVCNFFTQNENKNQ